MSRLRDSYTSYQLQYGWTVGALPHHPAFPFCYTVPVYVVKKSHFSKKRKNGQNQKKYCKAKLQYEEKRVNWQRTCARN